MNPMRSAVVSAQRAFYEFCIDRGVVVNALDFYHGGAGSILTAGYLVFNRSFPLVRQSS